MIVPRGEGSARAHLVPVRVLGPHPPPLEPLPPASAGLEGAGAARRSACGKLKNASGGIAHFLVEPDLTSSAMGALSAPLMTEPRWTARAQSKKATTDCSLYVTCVGGTESEWGGERRAAARTTRGGGWEATRGYSSRSGQGRAGRGGQAQRIWWGPGDDPMREALTVVLVPCGRSTVSNLYTTGSSRWYPIATHLWRGSPWPVK